MKVKPPITKKREEKAYFLGEFLFHIKGEVYGVVAASLSLSTEIAFGPSDLGGFGVKGHTIKEDDYNHCLTNISRKTRQAPSSQSKSCQVGLSGSGNLAAQATAKGSAFAGIEVGGRLSGAFYWRPPERESYCKFGEIGLQGALNAGAGADFVCSIMIHKHRFYFLVGAKLIVGTGASGSVSVEINPEAAENFIDHFLGVLRCYGYQHLKILGDDETFDRLNKLLTFALVLGVSIAQVLLLPTKVIRKYDEFKINQKYGPMIVEHINNRLKKDQMREWIQNVPPETLANVFNMLVLSSSQKNN